MTMTPPLTELGWEAAPLTAPRRLIVLLDGLKGTGKTHVACTMPGPIWYIRIDTGDEGVVDRFAAGTIPGQPPKEIHMLRTSFTNENIAETYPSFKHSILATAELVKATSFGVGTFIVDTWDEVYESGRLYHFRGSQSSDQRNYGPVYLDMRQMNRAIQDTGCNAVFIHKVANFRGETYRKGWKDFEYECQVVINLRAEQHPLDPPPEQGSQTWTRFVGQVTECRQNPTVQGAWLTSDAGTLDLSSLIEVVHG